MSIKVLIADDHQIIREGLRVMLEKEHDIKIVGEAEDGRMAERLARDLALLQDQYAILIVQPFDLFPHTAHTECVVRLERRHPVPAG